MMQPTDRPSARRFPGRFAAVLPGLLISLLLSGCATPPDVLHAESRQANAQASVEPTALAALMRQSRTVLLGEIHDHPEGHRLRQEALAAAVGPGWLPAIALEQVDVEDQARLDAAVQRCADARCLADALSAISPGWEWALYEPILALALREHLPLLAANLSRSQASGIVRAGLQGPVATRLLSMPIPANLQQAQQDLAADSHCGMLPAEFYPRMAIAQMARDEQMAAVLRGVTDRPVVLLAGNGHVRRDLGVAVWLASRPSLAIGYVEQSYGAAAFDREVLLRGHARPDPCTAIRQAREPSAR